MKKSFLLLLPVLLLVFSESCAKKGKAGSVDPDDTIKGRTVIALNSDSTPRVVYYYKVDQTGKITDERIHETHYFPGKKKYTDGGIKNGMRDGQWFAYFENGKINTEANYVEDKEHGAYKVYYENGQLYYSGHYDMGICKGDWLFYAVDGTLNNTIVANDTTIVCGTCPRCNDIRQITK